MSIQNIDLFRRKTITILKFSAEEMIPSESLALHWLKLDLIQQLIRVNVEVGGCSLRRPRVARREQYDAPS